MNQLLNNRVGKKPKTKGKGCLFLLAGSLLALLATVLFALGTLTLVRLTVEAQLEGEMAYVLLTAFKPCLIVALILFYGILALWYFTPTEAEVRAMNSRMTPGSTPTVRALPRRVLWLITAAMLVGVLLCGLICLNSYRTVSEDGISSHFFVKTADYTWDDVNTYVVDCDNEDGLLLTFTMRDGKQFEILSGINSTPEAFDTAFPSVIHFAAHLDEEMTSRGVPRNVRHMERAVKNYKDNKNLWEPVSRLIGYVDLLPEPDETAPATEAPTEAPATDTGN